MSSAPCKHQGAVLVKFHISMFNFILSLKPDNHTVYAYIALGYSAQDKSFYALLHANPILQNQEPEELDKENKEIEEIDSSDFNSFLEEVSNLDPTARIKSGP
ncbi:hypothetical protein C2G38_2217937 [Gigaspora rosea]|uniref:Uncharacterized protein n=1 Tax=Gigaspora rosea TaxID=44941 RepID=A0A397UAP4_9GLOM|nr:hypothetical protein C2G38_2217937 [Gigaspora rosea]